MIIGVGSLIGWFLQQHDSEWAVVRNIGGRLHIDFYTDEEAALNFYRSVAKSTDIVDLYLRGERVRSNCDTA